MQESKRCSTCEQTKTLDQFHKRLEGKAPSCKECIKVKTKARYQANAETLRQKARDYRKANPEKVRAAKLAWKRANPEKNVSSVVAYLRRNPDKHFKHAKAYKEKNREKYREWGAKRNAKMSKCKTYEIREKEIKKLYTNPCFVCGSKKNQTIDHIIPIDLGGNHGIGNLQTLCLSCNSSKRNRVMTVWKKTLTKRL